MVQCQVATDVVLQAEYVRNKNGKKSAPRLFDLQHAVFSLLRRSKVWIDEFGVEVPVPWRRKWLTSGFRHRSFSTQVAVARTPLSIVPGGGRVGKDYCDTTDQGSDGQ